jgi:hypothetical protein
MCVSMFVFRTTAFHEVKIEFWYIIILDLNL